MNYAMSTKISAKFALILGAIIVFILGVRISKAIGIKIDTNLQVGKVL